MEADVKAEFRSMRAEMKVEFEKIDARFEELMGMLARQFAQIDQRFERIENTMVTKDYLDKKLGNFAAVNNLRLRDEGEEYKNSKS